MAAEYEMWEQIVPETIRQDTLWRLKAYRFALYLSDIAWEDTTKLLKDRRTVSISDQLVRAVGSIGANIAEGYGKSSGKDRTRFYEYALGSARESRDWYHKARHILGQANIGKQLELLEAIIRLLLVMIPDQREHRIGEATIEYTTNQ